MALLHYFLFSFLTTLATADVQTLHSQDLHSLLSFKASADPRSIALRTWKGPNPCSGSWVGIECDGGRVASVHLDDASLIGNIAPLLRLSQLQVLSLRRNALAGPIPHLTNLTVPGLKHLLLSHNRFNGTLSIYLPSLLSLRLEHNGFSGGLEGLQLPLAEVFNVSENRLSGEISAPLSKFPESAFGGNPHLCGSPLPSCTKTSRAFRTTAVSPSPTPSLPLNCTSKTITKLGMPAVLAIGVGDVLVISIALVLVVGMYMWLTKKRAIPRHKPTKIREERRKAGGLVCFQGGEDLRLESLLKSSAEVLGKGVAGSTYKAVLDCGLPVAVKRLDAKRFPSRGKAFDRRMNLVGKLRHCHVVSLRAYCNSDEEKLLVYDYIPNGSLHSLLHSNSGGNQRTRGLNWKRRKQILMGAADGLNFIHTFPARPPLVHCNFKPSNILIDGQGNALVSEWGIMCFANSIHRPCPTYSEFFSCTTDCRDTATWLGYRAPELLNDKRSATQESDVYSFGMVLLEVVTDNEIKEAECEGEMMGMVKIGVMCTKECPEERPKMSQVARMINEML